MSRDWIPTRRTAVDEILRIWHDAAQVPGFSSVKWDIATEVLLKTFSEEELDKIPGSEEA